jgi:tetratricopeptide (TPR) repeat protein
MKKAAIILFILLCHFNVTLAQTEPDAVALANDEFQDFFFEALKQKGIENYDKAISALEKCSKLQPENATIYFEIGKNYLNQKDYTEAYNAFSKAAKIDPTNKWFWVGMYDVYYETKQFDKAIPIVVKLVEFDKRYKDELVSLYMNTQRFDEALALINELNTTVGKSDMRDNYKFQILQDPKYQGAERLHLLEQIKVNPKEEANYVALIYLYNRNNQEAQAQEIAKKLEAAIPNSDWAQVSLFKLHLINKEGERAVKAMNAVLSSPKIDNKIKHRMLNEFLIFIKDKPQFDPDLEKAIGYFDQDKEVRVAKEIGKFYHNKENWDKAIRYYEIYLTKQPEDLETALLLLEVYVELGQFSTVSSKAESLIQIYPAQPQGYYFLGLSLNQLKQFSKAKEILEMGLDYLVDNTTLEVNFYIQLGEAYNGLGDQKKKEFYFIKAEAGLKQKKQ